MEEHVDNMNDGEENHNGAQAQIEDTGEIAVYKFFKNWSITQDYKCAKNNRTLKASTLRKTEQWKLASDYFTFFALRR